eukprot:357916-Chlamydomonas_euryale.AAC.13
MQGWKDMIKGSWEVKEVWEVKVGKASWGNKGERGSSRCGCVNRETGPSMGERSTGTRQDLER